MSSLPETSDANNNTGDVPPYSSTAGQMQQSIEMGQPQHINQTAIEQEEEVAVAQPPITVVVSPPPTQQQQQQQQQVVYSVPPADAANTVVPVAENPYLKSNNVVTDKRKEFMAGVDNGYYRVKPELDKLDEMKPWESDGQMYSFACCTEYYQGSTDVDPQEDKKLQSVGTATAESSSAHTVYHKTNTEMLTVLKKEFNANSSTFDFSTKNSNKCMWITVTVLGVLGLIMMIAGGVVLGDSESDNEDSYNSYYDTNDDSGSDGTGEALLGVGAIFLVIAIIIVIVVLCQRKKATGSSLNSSKTMEIVTSSIPIYCVRSVKRKATLTYSRSSESVHSSNCNCCAPVNVPLKNEEEKDDMCVVTIYYQLVDAKSEDKIELNLSAHQGFNLQRYLQCIIDGCHPKWRENHGERNQYQLELKKEKHT